MGVDVDGDEQVGPGLVGFARAVAQAHGHILAPAVDDFQAVVLQQTAQPQGDVQRDVALDHVVVDGARITATVPGIDEHALHGKSRLSGHHIVDPDGLALAGGGIRQPAARSGDRGQLPAQGRGLGAHVAAGVFLFQTGQ